jgi:hypothetical protein
MFREGKGKRLRAKKGKGEKDLHFFRWDSTSPTAPRARTHARTTKRNDFPVGLTPNLRYIHIYMYISEDGKGEINQEIVSFRVSRVLGEINHPVVFPFWRLSFSLFPSVSN